jgi:hypothetical protein
MLFTCNRVQLVWNELLPFWRRLVRHDVVWRDVVLGLRVERMVESSAHVECVKIVWTVLCSVVLHQVWRTRNRWVFENRAFSPTDAMVKIILSTFASHLRYLQRIWGTNQDKSRALKWFRNRLIECEPYQRYYREHPTLLHQRPAPSTLTCWFPVPTSRLASHQ